MKHINIKNKIFWWTDFFLPKPLSFLPCFLLVFTTVHHHACHANCSFYLMQCLIAGTCSSGHGADQRQNQPQQHKPRLFWNRQQQCLALILSPAKQGWVHLSGISTRWQFQLENSWGGNGKDECGTERGNERKDRDWKKGGWKELAFNLIIRFLNSDGCGWICIALGWQWPTFLLLSFWTTASTFHYVCQGGFCDEENNSAGM